MGKGKRRYEKAKEEGGRRKKKIKEKWDRKRTVCNLGKCIWSGEGGMGKLLMQIEPCHKGAVPTHRVNTHKDRRDIRHQTADSRQRSSCYRSIVCVLNGCHEIPRFWEIPRLVSLSQN
jgi:hypothetical protein